MSGSEDDRPEDGISEADAVLLSAYLDDELSPQDRRELEERLLADPALKAELEALRSSGDVLRQADALNAPVSNDSAASLTTVRHRLRAEYPDDDLPVAQALRPSRIRRLAIISVAAILAILILAVVVGLLQSLGLPTPCGWNARPVEGKVAIERRDRIVLALDQELLLVGDRLHLDLGEQAILSGPAGLRVHVTGPAVVRCDGHGELYVEQGHVEVEGHASSADELRLVTPDGRIRPEGKDAFNFAVDVKEHPTAQP